MGFKNTQISSNEVFLIDGWTFNQSLCRLQKHHNTVKLEPRVGQLLNYLCHHANVALARETLMEQVWPGMIVGDEALNNTVNKLRKAFNDDRQNPRVIETLPKIGYRLIASVEALDATDNSSNKITAIQQKLPAINRVVILGVVALISVSIYWLWVDRNNSVADVISAANKSVLPVDQNAQSVVYNKKRPSNVNTIAVMPFENLNRDPDQDYFSDGMTDDLITDLSKISSLSVIARNSVFSFKGQSVLIQDIAQRLGASHVLEGSIRRAGNRIRINAQFIDAATGLHLWAERYDRDLKNVFELQDEITEKIVTALKIQLSALEKARLEKRYTNDIEAYDLFLKGQKAFLKYTREGNSEARLYFQQASKLDPKFARAFANYGWTYARDFQDGWTSTPKKTLDKALKLVLNARALDETSSRVHWILGQVFLYKRDYQQAIDNVEKAIELSPGNPDPKILLARILMFSGDPSRSITLIQEAMKINPLYPMQYQMNLGISHFANGDYIKAKKALINALERNPDAQRVRMWLVASYANSGELELANWEYEELIMINPEFSLKNLQYSIPFKDQSIRDRLFKGLEIAANR